MIFEITHTTTFSYERPVFLEPTVVRLRPRCDCTQALLDYALTLTPEPVSNSQNVGLDGNGMRSCCFEGLYESLIITATSRVQTLRTNPYDYLLTDVMALKLPVSYDLDHDAALMPYLNRDHASAEVNLFAQELQTQADGVTQTFLSLLVERIAALGERVIRDEGEPMKPKVTLAAPQSSCRDLTVLAMDACRAVGLATRFVSGYQQCDDEVTHFHLHGWFEVYLPGAGWRGYDPTNGVAVADRHVALCAAAEPRLAAPTTGTYRGTGVGSHLEYALTLKVSPDKP